MSQQNTIKEIQSFLEGKNNEVKYLVNVETDASERFATCVIHEPNKDKEIRKIDFESFIYIKDLEKTGHILFNGNKDKLEVMLVKHGITFKKMKTGNHPRLENGFPYKVTTSRTYQDILDFFKEANLDPFQKIYDDNNKLVYTDRGFPASKYRELFYLPKLNEQFFISTGIRLFKGFEEYNDIHKLTYDIETTGLRYEHSRIFAIGIKDNRGLEHVLEVDKDDDDDAEIKIIQNFFNMCDMYKPAVISGYNSENFDYDFILGRAEILRMDIAKLNTTIRKDKKLWRKNSTVKFGNSTERYKGTVAYGFTILDIIHAVKKTAAVNSEIKNNKLKYICKYEGIAKPNRMYIDGAEIGRFWKQNPMFILNSIDNKYIEIPQEHTHTSEELYLLQENKNTITINEYNIAKKSLLDANKEFVIWLKKNTPKLFNDPTQIKEGFKFENGKNILRRYLLDDLWETEQVDNLYNQSSFLLAKIVPTVYGRVATMGNAAVWNLLMTAWSYENDLAIPHPDDIERFSGGLARCYKKGYTKRLIKIDFASLYPMIQLTHDVFPIFDITGVIKKMLTYMTTTRNIYKKLANGDSLQESEVELLKTVDHETYDKYVANSFTKEERNLFKVKQLPIKILNNSLFGALGSGFAFNWSDNICAARITTSGRIYLRQAIDFFKGYGLDPLLAVTDGINFGVPDNTCKIITNDGEELTRGLIPIEEAWQYNGKVGVGALIEYFNDHLKDYHNNESVTYDTPIYINNNGEIDIVPICELFDEESKYLDDTKERDYAKKNFKVLTKTGWNDIKYVFKHKTNKNIHRITTKDRLINVTEDHSLFQNGIEIKPKNLLNGDVLDIVDVPSNNIKNNVSYEKAWLYGFFFGDGSSTNSVRSKIVGDKVNKLGTRRSWKISNTNKAFLNKCIEIINQEYNINLGIIDRSVSQKKSNNVKPLYEIVSFNKDMSEFFSKNFYTSYREKKIPSEILNSNEDIKRAFIYGALDSDGYYLGLFDIKSFGQKTQIGMAGFSYLLKSIGVDYSISLRKDKSNFITFRFDREFNEKYKNIISLKINTNSIHNNYIFNSKNEYVYDISTTDETFVGGIGGILCHNTSKGRENCYLSVDNDGEFESCLNLSRINYALKTPTKIKFTGNTIKSKTMPEYIEDFIDKGMEYILNGDGESFVEYYYDYSEKIFYRQMPLKKIASKSRVKNSLDDYINRGTDKNGRLKAKQAHMEMIIAEREKIAMEIFKERIDQFIDDKEPKTIDDFSIFDIMELVESYMPPEPEIDSTVYYVNVGSRKSHGDVKADPKSGETIINANLINSKNLEENPEMTGDYNVEKYLAAFNKRVEVLLDGFDPEIRADILVKIVRKKIKDTSGAKVEQIDLKKGEFLSSQLKLKNFEHDNYEDSMHLEDKEVEFWNRTGYNPKLIWDGFKTKDDEKHGLLYPEIYQNALDYLSDAMVKSNKPRIKSLNESLGKGDYVLIKNFMKVKEHKNENKYIFQIGKHWLRNRFDVGYHNGEFIEILKEDVNVPLSDIEKGWIEAEKLKEIELSKLRVEDETYIKKQREEIEKKHGEKVEYFRLFLEKHNLPSHYQMEEIFKANPNAKIAFEDFIEFKKREFEPEIYYDESDL